MHVAYVARGVGEYARGPQRIAQVMPTRLELGGQAAVDGADRAIQERVERAQM